MSVRLILDTDIGSDVDDALALAFALRHPDIDLVAVTTVADDTIKRARIARQVLRAAGREDVEIAPGVGWGSCPHPERRSWFGHEDKLLAGDGDAISFDRDGVTLLLDETKNGDVEVATVGMQSNAASAVQHDASFAGRVKRLDVMGGVFAPIRIGDQVIPTAWDHNLMIDRDASVRSLNAGFNSMYCPVDVTVQAPLPRSHLERLRDGDELCRTLARHLDHWISVANPADDVAAILHDPLCVACTVDRRFVTTETLPVTVAVHEGVVRTFIDRADGRPAEVITSVDGAGFADFWLETVLSA
jgi:purine nucleosidase